MFASSHASMRGLKGSRQSGTTAGDHHPEETVSLGGGEMINSPPLHPPVCIDPGQAFAGINSGTSTFRRPRAAGTAGISRGSMFNLDRQCEVGVGEFPSDRGGFPLQQPHQVKQNDGSMTPGPGRRSNQVILICWSHLSHRQFTCNYVPIAMQWEYAWTSCKKVHVQVCLAEQKWKGMARPG